MRSTLYWLRYGHYTALTLLYIQYNTIRTRVCIIAISLLYSELLYILCAVENTLHSILLILHYTYNTIHCTLCILCQTYYTVDMILCIPHNSTLHGTMLRYTCYTAHALLYSITPYALCILHCINCSIHTKNHQEHAIHTTLDTLEKGYAYETAHAVNAFRYSAVHVLLQRLFYTHSTSILGYPCYTTRTVCIAPCTFYTSHRMQIIMSIIVYIPYTIQSVPYCAYIVTQSKLVYAYFACIYIPSLCLFCCTYILYHAYSTCFMVLCTFHTLDQTILLHIQYVRKHMFYIRYRTYSTIHTIRYYFTCYAVHAFLYVLRNTNCSKCTVLYMLYSTCQATDTTLHIISCLYLPYAFFYRYYTSLY